MLVFLNFLVLAEVLLQEEASPSILPGGPAKVLLQEVAFLSLPQKRTIAPLRLLFQPWQKLQMRLFDLLLL